MVLYTVQQIHGRGQIMSLKSNDPVLKHFSIIRGLLPLVEITCSDYFFFSLTTRFASDTIIVLPNTKLDCYESGGSNNGMLYFVYYNLNTATKYVVMISFWLIDIITKHSAGVEMDIDICSSYLAHITHITLTSFKSQGHSYFRWFSHYIPLLHWLLEQHSFCWPSFLCWLKDRSL